MITALGGDSFINLSHFSIESITSTLKVRPRSFAALSRYSRILVTRRSGVVHEPWDSETFRM
jgi:hypothetical protein